MKRLMVAALLVSSVSAVANIPSSVSAVVEEGPEPIARTFVTTSPQLSGPGGVVPWGLDRIDQRNAVTANRSYSFTSTGTGVNVYIVDSGVDADHPEFGSRVQNGWSYRTSSTALASYSSALAAYQQNPATGIKPCTLDRARYSHEVDPSTFDNPPAVVPSDLGRTDNDGHGTHVAGIATGDSVGVAKNATIIPVRVMDSCGSGSSTMIAEGLRWVLADHDPGERAVVNLSIGFGSRVASIDNAIVDLMNEGILIVAAAGNSATSACNSTPADTADSIAVGSSTITDFASSFSNYGSCVEMYAPGGASGGTIQSAYPYYNGSTGTYVGLAGTSMATPFVTGALALYLQNLASAPTTKTNGQTTAWNWLNTNATTGKPTPVYSQVGQNSLLYIPPGPPAQVTSLTALPANAGAVVSWSSNIPDATYTAVATPGNVLCNTVGGNTCTLTGLTNGSTYTITVTGTSSDGTGAGATTTVVAGLPPDAPATISTSVKNAEVALVWAASTVPGATYTITSIPTSSGCITTTTTCTITGLKNGVNYIFSVTTTSTTGLQSAAPVTISARPGFVVKKTIVKKGSRTLFSSLLTTLSRGKKTWSETGACSIASGRLVAPRRVTTCSLKLTVAKSGSYPKMSTTLKVSVK